MGLVSRRGFVVVDDTNAVELDDSQWPWVRKEGKSAPPEAKCNMDMEERRQCGTRLLSQEEVNFLSAPMYATISATMSSIYLLLSLPRCMFRYMLRARTDAQRLAHQCEDEGCCYDDVISSCFYSSAATQGQIAALAPCDVWR